LVVEITALVFDMAVHSAKLLNSLPVPVAGFLSPAGFMFHPAKLGLCGVVIAGILNCCPVTENGKACNTHINADHCTGLR